MIVSNDSSNKFLNRLQVVPITSKVNRVYPSEAAVTVGGKPCKAMADQLATVSKVRLSKRIGQLSGLEIRHIEQAIRIQLALPT